MTDLAPKMIEVGLKDLESMLHEAGSNALRSAANEARIRGDIGKEDGVEAWDFLEFRARQTENCDTDLGLAVIQVDVPAIDRGARKLAAILDVDWDKAYPGYQASLKASVRAIVDALKAPEPTTEPTTD